jgi:hypothetical protein
MTAMSLRGISLGLVVASAVVAEQAAAGESKLPADVPSATRLFNCDFNWARWPPSESLPHGNVRPSLPEDWAEVDARAYFHWHREFGNNVVYCQAYCSSGFALYPSKLGPVGKGKAARLFPELYALARQAKLPVWSFNVPFHKADEALWRDHPMLAESDGLFAESSDDVVGWLLRVRKPGQRVMTTIIGRGQGVTDPGSWKKWYDQGCDFFGYAWGTPPSFLPTAMYDEELKVVKAAFAEMQKLDAARARNAK